MKNILIDIDDQVNYIETAVDKAYVMVDDINSFFVGYDAKKSKYDVDDVKIKNDIVEQQLHDIRQYIAEIRKSINETGLTPEGVEVKTA